MMSLLQDYNNQLSSKNDLAQSRVEKSRCRPLKVSYQLSQNLKETLRNPLFTSASLQSLQASMNNSLFKYLTTSLSKVIFNPAMNIVTVVSQILDHPDTQKASSISLVDLKKKFQSILSILRNKIKVNAYLSCNKAWVVVTKTIALLSKKYKDNKEFALVIKRKAVINTILTRLKSITLQIQYIAKRKINSSKNYPSKLDKIQPLPAAALIHKILKLKHLPS